MKPHVANYFHLLKTLLLYMSSVEHMLLFAMVLKEIEDYVPKVSTVEPELEVRGYARLALWLFNSGILVYDLLEYWMY